MLRNRKTCGIDKGYYPILKNVSLPATTTVTTIPTTEFLIGSTTTLKPSSFFDIFSNPVQTSFDTVTFSDIYGYINFKATGVIKKENKKYNFAAASNCIYLYDTNWIFKSIMDLKSIALNFITVADNQFYISSDDTAGLIHTSSNLTILHTYGAIGEY